jgi:hypothetical protein
MQLQRIVRCEAIRHPLQVPLGERIEDRARVPVGPALVSNQVMHLLPELRKRPTGNRLRGTRAFGLERVVGIQVAADKPAGVRTLGEDPIRLELEELVKPIHRQS